MTAGCFFPSWLHTVTVGCVASVFLANKQFPLVSIASRATAQRRPAHTPTVAVGATLAADDGGWRREAAQPDGQTQHGNVSAAGEHQPSSVVRRVGGRMERREDDERDQAMMHRRGVVDAPYDDVVITADSRRLIPSLNLDQLRPKAKLTPSVH